jgi:hypothetical protein
MITAEASTWEAVATWDSAAFHVGDVEDQATLLEDRATLAKREALETVSRVEAKNAMVLASAHEGAKVLVWKISLLEDELTVKYTSLDDELHQRTIDDMLLKCLGDEQAKEAVWEVHDGICGAHQSAHKMKWLLRRAGFYWPIMMDDCIKYQKGCKVGQWFGNIQLAPTSVMNSIVKPWSFKGWGLDFIGEIHPESSKGHRFILVSMNYFTKWTEVVPLRNMTHREVKSFVEEHIVYRFRVPQTLTTDQGPSFMSHQFMEFAESIKIKLMNSSPYYAQANGQAEATNKVLIKIIKRRIEDNPRRWHEK